MKRAATRRYILTLASAGVLLSMAPSAWAQNEALPPISFRALDLREAGENPFTIDENPVFDYDNPYLNDTLRLQYQNILLEKMILRQGAIARTEKSFMEVGVPFNQPPPPRGICEQIPVNVPCYKAYPDLYPGAVAEVSQITQEEGALPLQPLPAAVLESTPAPTKVAIKREPPPKPAFDFDAYRWAEITCAGGQCRAVIAHEGRRQSVRVGDTIGDGVTITQINAMKVEASKDGKTQILQAALAPSQGGAASPKFGGSGVASSGTSFAEPTGSLSQKSQQVEAMFGGTAEKAAPKSPQIGSIDPPTGRDAPEPAEADDEPDDEPVAATGGGGIADPGPPLGPTGLF